MSGDAFSIPEQLTQRGFAAGQRYFGRFTLIRPLGRGGMAVVWLAKDEILEGEVALKFLPDAVRWDPTALAALRRETRRARDLTHGGIVRVHDIHEEQGAAAIAMEYLPGGSLQQHRALRDPPVLTCAEIAAWLPGLCVALDHAHAHGVVHRDLKAANLLIAADGAVKISDFGIAQPLFETALRVSQWAPSGTIAYMSPQQQFGEPASAADDIYALGATLYELLTGKPPFFSGNIAAQVERRPPDSLNVRRSQFGVTGEVIPPVWEKTIAACLAKRVEDRPGTAAQVADALAGAASGTPAKQLNGKAQWRLNVPARDWLTRGAGGRAWLGWGGVAIALGAVTATWYVSRQHASGQKDQAVVYASDASRALAAWNFDGNGRDASGRGFDLTLFGTTPTPDRHGRIDRALRFNGSALAEGEGGPALRWSGAQPFTVALWVRPKGEEKKGAVLIASRPARQGDHFWQLSLNQARPHFHSDRLQVAEPDQVMGSQPAPAGQWSHLAAVNTGKELSVYLNGQLVGRAPLRTSRTAPTPGEATLCLGQFGKFAADKFVGELDDARVWRRALTAEEIAMLATPSPAPRFLSTRGTYAEKEDLPAAIGREFGDGASLADWEEVQRWRGHDGRALADELELQVGSGDLLVQRKGARFIDGGRHYFLSRFDGRKPDYYDAHDELGGMTLALGSWHGMKLAALAKLPFIAPQSTRLEGTGLAGVVADFAPGHETTVAAMTWRQEFTRVKSSIAQAEIVLKDGRVLIAACRANAGATFALALGDVARPQLAQEIGATYDNVDFTLVLRRDRLEFRATSGIGTTPLFQEAVTLPHFKPEDLDRISVPGVDSATLTREK